MALLVVVRITDGFQGTDVIGLEPVTHRLLLQLLKYSFPSTNIILNMQIHILFCLKFHINISFIQNLNTAVTKTKDITVIEIMLR